MPPVMSVRDEARRRRAMRSRGSISPEVEIELTRGGKHLLDIGADESCILWLSVVFYRLLLTTRHTIRYIKVVSS